MTYQLRMLGLILALLILSALLGLLAPAVAAVIFPAV